jgi:hypothetical protein
VKDAVPPSKILEVNMGKTVYNAWPFMDDAEIEREFAGLKYDWPGLAKRCFASIRKAGGPDKSSEGLFLEVTGATDFYVHLGTYSIGDWPRHTERSFPSEGEAYWWAQAVVMKAEEMVNNG